MAAFARPLLELLRLPASRTAPDPRPWRQAPRALPALLAREGAVTWCWRRLRETGLDGALPPAVAGALRAASGHDEAQNLLVDEAAEAALALLASRGVACVLLKGTARRALAPTCPYADARPTRDVDLLLPADAVAAAWQDFRDAGYTFATDPAATPAGHFHPPPLAGPQRVAVELHASTDAAVSPPEAWRRSTSDGSTTTWRGREVCVPSPTELLWHAVVHAMRDGPGGFRLRFLLDAATVVACGRAVRWDAVAERLRGPEIADAGHARAWLGAAAWLGGGPLPRDVAEGVAPFDLERALDWRLAVARHAGRPRTAEALREEGTRVLLHLPARPPVPGTSRAVRLRRRCSSAIARFAYRCWAAARRAAPA